MLRGKAKGQVVPCHVGSAASLHHGLVTAELGWPPDLYSIIIHHISLFGKGASLTEYTQVPWQIV